MLFAIHALDLPGMAALRLDHYPAHKAYLDRDPADLGVAIVMSGPLTTDDGVTMIGSLFLIEAPDRDAVERFHRADPFHRAGIWQPASIHAFSRRRG